MSENPCHARPGTCSCGACCRGERARVEKERDIVHAIRLALGADERVVLFRNSTGQTTEWTETTERHIRYGLTKGSSDLIGIVTCEREVLLPESESINGMRPTTTEFEKIGRFFALEVKTPVGRLTLDQRRFLNLVRRMGGFAACVRSVEEAQAAVARAVRGEAS